MSSYSTPEQEFRTTHFKIEARRIRKGDVLFLHNAEVTDVKVGTKWVTGQTQRGKHQFALDEQVVVTRQVETEESKTARMRAHLNQRLEQKVSEHELMSNTKRQLAQISDKVARDNRPDSFEMTALLDAQAEDEVWDGFVYTVNRVTLGSEGFEDHVAVLEGYQEELKKELVQKSRYGLSRSTSVVSNVMEDAKRAAIASFIDRWPFLI